MKPRDSGLFDLDDSAPAEKQTAPNPMTARQRQTIRELFAQIGVVAQIGPGQSVSGWIVLDVASPTGAVVLAMGGSPVGWEWAY